MSVALEICRAHSEDEIDDATVVAARALGTGALVLHPTETVYGIGGAADEAMNRVVARVKRREVDQPLILLIPDADAARTLLPGIRWASAAERLAESFWPGPLTLVLPCRDAPDGLLGPGGGVALRVSSHPVIQALLRRWGRPMTSTSANLTGQAAPVTMEDALGLFDARGDLQDLDLRVIALDAGSTPHGRPSTILSLVESTPSLIREGAVPVRTLRELLPEIQAT